VKVRQVVTLPEHTLRGLAAWYTALPAPLAQSDRRVLRKALRLAGGDPRRCTAEPDGSIIVWNRPVW
jgi:hypothetical protein